MAVSELTAIPMKLWPWSAESDPVPKDWIEILGGKERDAKS